MTTTTIVRRMFVTAGSATLLCALAVVPAHAEDAGPWVAAAYSKVDGSGAVATGATEGAAKNAARTQCAGANCISVAWNDATVDPACVAIIKGATPADYWVGQGDTQTEAEQSAFAQQPGSGPLLVASGCATVDDAPVDDEPAGGSGTATVTSDVDIYAVPDGVGTPYPGVFLEAGDTYELVEPCRDNWCHLYIDFIPGGQGWVYQDGFLDVS